MELTHQFTVPTSVDDAWAAFNDLERIAPCFPGASLTSFDGESFEGLVKVKLGPISMQYNGIGRFAERDEATHRAVVEAKGKDKRGNGTAAATVTATLTSRGETTTDVTVTTDLNITGKPAQFGRSVMQDVSDRLLAQFAACLETTLGESPAGGPSTALDPADGPAAVEHRAEVKPESPAAPAAASVPPAAASRPEPEPVAALDVGAAVVPVLLRRYAPQIIGAIVGLWLLRKLLRRRR